MPCSFPENQHLSPSHVRPDPVDRSLAPHHITTHITTAASIVIPSIGQPTRQATSDASARDHFFYHLSNERLHPSIQLCPKQ